MKLFNPHAGNGKGGNLAPWWFMQNLT